MFFYAADVNYAVKMKLVSLPTSGRHPPEWHLFPEDGFGREVKD